MGVGPLTNPEDGLRFVSKRISNSNMEGMKFDESALKEFISFSANRGGASIRELEAVCDKALEDAKINRKTVIDITDKKMILSNFKVIKAVNV